MNCLSRLSDIKIFPVSVIQVTGLEISALRTHEMGELKSDGLVISGIAHRVERFLVAGGDQHPLLPDKFEKILLSKYVQIHLFHCCFVLYRGHIFDPVTVNSANLHKKLIFSSVCANETIYSADTRHVFTSQGFIKMKDYLDVRNNVHIFATIRIFDMTTTTATNFRSNVKRYLDLVINDSQEVVISRGSDSAVLIPLDQYNSIKETEYLMSSKEMERVILQGMEDIKNGNFTEVNIDEL